MIKLCKRGKLPLFYIQCYFIKKELINVKHEYIIEELDENTSISRENYAEEDENEREL